MGHGPEESPSLNSKTEVRTRYSLVDSTPPQVQEDSKTWRPWPFNSKTVVADEKKEKKVSTPRRSRAKSMPRKKPTNIEGEEKVRFRSRTRSVPCNALHRRSMKEKNDGSVIYPQQVRSFTTSTRGSIINRGDSVRLFSLTNTSDESAQNSPRVSSSSSPSVSPGELKTFRDIFRSRNTHQKRPTSCSSVEVEPHHVLLMGGVGVGKSSLAQQFMTSEDVTQLDHQIDQLPGEIIFIESAYFLCGKC